MGTGSGRSGARTRTIPRPPVHDRIGPPGSWPRRLMALFAMLFAVGAVLFSGGLTALAADLHYVVGTAPWGGHALIAGWITLAVAAVTALMRKKD